MKRNVGTVDRAVRVLAGLGLIGFALLGGSAWGYLGVVPLFTGLIGWCPAYSLLGISTRRKCANTDEDAGCACQSQH